MRHYIKTHTKKKATSKVTVCGIGAKGTSGTSILENSKSASRILRNSSRTSRTVFKTIYFIVIKRGRGGLGVEEREEGSGG